MGLELEFYCCHNRQKVIKYGGSLPKEIMDNVLVCRSWVTLQRKN